MKLTDFNLMTKIGDLKSNPNKSNADGSSPHTETFQDVDKKFYQLDRQNNQYREIFEDRTIDDGWLDLED